MIGSIGGLKIFLCTQPTDMRRSFDGLSGMVQSIMKLDPLSGHLFVFRNRSRDSIVQVGVLFPCSLKDDFDIDLFHLLANFPVHYAPRATIEHATHEVKRAANVEVANIQVPVIVRFGGLAEAGSLLRLSAIKAIHHAGIS